MQVKKLYTRRNVYGILLWSIIVIERRSRSLASHRLTDRAPAPAPVKVSLAGDEAA